MAIELRNPLTITEETKIYGHNTVDIDGVPTDAGNGNVGQIVDIVDTKYIQGIKTDIDNIKAKINGEIYRTQLVDANAYQIDVPSPVFPYAEVQKLKGKSVVWNSMLNNAVVGSISSEGIFSYTLPSDTTKDDTKFLIETLNNVVQHGHKYLVKFVNITNTTRMVLYFNQNPNWTNNTINTGSGFIYTTATVGEGNLGRFVVMLYGKGVSGGTVSGKFSLFDLTQMFGSGNEPTLEECQKIFSADYYPYDAGTLKSFPVKTVKSVGKNLIDSSKEKDNYFIQSANGGMSSWTGSKCTDFIKVEAGEKYYFSGMNTLNSGNTGAMYDFNKKYVGPINDDINIRPITIPNGVAYIRLTIWKNNFLNTEMAQLEKGSVATDFTPYIESTIDLSSATTDMKSAGSVSDEWQNGKVTKRVGVVDLGTLVWNYYSNSDVFWAKLPSRKASTNGHRLLCNKYTSYDGFENLQNKGICVSWLAEDTDIAIKDTSFGTDTSAFKSAMSGVMLYYELATPTEETVPLTEQFIDVESNGTLTFISDETVQMPIESTTKFVVNLEEV